MILNKKEYGAEAGKIVDVGIVGAGAEKVVDADIVAAGAEAGAEREIGATTEGTEVPAVRGGTADTDTNAAAVGAKSAERDPDGVAAEAETGAVRVLGREAAALSTNMIAIRNKAALKIQVTKRKLKALTM